MRRFSESESLKALPGDLADRVWRETAVPPVFGKEEIKPISYQHGGSVFFMRIAHGKVSQIEYESSKKIVDWLVGKSGS